MRPPLSPPFMGLLLRPRFSIPTVGPGCPFPPLPPTTDIIVFFLSDPFSPPSSRSLFLPLLRHQARSFPTRTLSPSAFRPPTKCARCFGHPPRYVSLAFFFFTTLHFYLFFDDCSPPGIFLHPSQFWSPPPFSVRFCPCPRGRLRLLGLVSG